MPRTIWAWKSEQTLAFKNQVEYFLPRELRKEVARFILISFANQEAGFEKHSLFNGEPIWRLLGIGYLFACFRVLEATFTRLVNFECKLYMWTFALIMSHLWFFSK